MRGALRSFIFLSLSLLGKGNVIQWDAENKLQPVQGLYVKPSMDGTTGDLYVAASEDSGVGGQWVADQPVNFIPQQTPGASTYYSTQNSSLTPHDEIFTSHQRTTVFSGPQFKYNYPSSETNSAIPYPYAGMPPAEPHKDYPTQYHHHPYPIEYSHMVYQYYYPYIMSAAAAMATNALKEAGLSEEMTNAIMSHTSLWSQSYGYPSQHYP